ELDPGPLHTAYRFHPRGIANTELLPEGAPRRHAVLPGHVVKPKQKRFRTGRAIAPELTQGRTILRHRIAAAHRTVEPNAFTVGAVEVHRCPIGAAFRDPRARTIVVIPGYQVVQA